nr:peptidase [Lysobacter alkalisoli]
MAGLVACSGPQEEPAPTPTPAPESTTTPAPGSDRDAHGCIPSAGYAWCERSGQCERPWELAAQAGLDNTAEAFDEYCAATETEAPAQDG